MSAQRILPSVRAWSMWSTMTSVWTVSRRRVLGTVAVARAENVALEKVAGTLDLEWIALTEAERKQKGSPSLLAKHSLLLAVGARYRRLRSSMLASIERGREPAIDFLNGEVVQRAKKHGIAVPVNALVQKRIHDIAQKRTHSSLQTLRALYEETRAG